MPFDNPAFKVLAHNDTGGAIGHQGGVLIPKALASYFPVPSGTPSPVNPTVSAYITADLVDGTKTVDQVHTRYQHQTWTAKRSPERRITGNLGAIRSKASRNDILVMERSLSTPGHYRLSLFRKGTPQHQAVLSKAQGRRWGFLKEPIVI